MGPPQRVPTISAHALMMPMMTLLGQDETHDATIDP